MSSSNKISLSTAIFININIMLGAGIFINTAELAQRLQAFGGFMYLLVGLLLSPLIFSLIALVHKHPTGGFYTYGRNELSPFMGFVTTWSYFIGKLGSCTIMIFASIRLLQQLFPLLAAVPPLIAALSVIALFTALNTLRVQTGSSIQRLFTMFKMLPVAFVILVGAWLFKGSHVIFPGTLTPGIISSLPLVIFALIGFEAACSLSTLIENPKRNAPLAILISYTTVLMVSCLYQFFFQGALGPILATLNYRTIFPVLVQTALPTAGWLNYYLSGFFNIAIATSALGGAYGILFTNSWNLYTLAQNNHILHASLFTRLNKYDIPTACVITEGLICALYLLVTQGAQVPLQQLGALGVSLAYTGAVIALLAAVYNRSIMQSLLLPVLGLGSCIILVSSCIWGMLTTSLAPLFALATLLLGGVTMFAMTKKD